MPDLDQMLAGYGDNCGIAIAFAGKEFPAPFSQSGTRPLRMTAWAP